jgi:outer membrane lipoprotein-sorting protein
MMIKRFFQTSMGWLAVILALSGAASAAAQAPDFKAMILAIDSRSAVTDSDFSSIATVVSEDPEQGVLTRKVQRYRRDSQDLLAMVILEPEVQRGQASLRQGDNMWTYDPESRQFTHVSLEESYQGTTARNNDFNNFTFVNDYKVAGYAEERLGKFDCWAVDLEAVKDNVSYPFIRVWIDKASELLIQVADYGLSRRLLRTVMYTRYNRTGGRILPVKIVAVDEVTKGRRTTIEFANISFDALPDYVFTRAYIERLAR